MCSQTNRGAACESCCSSSQCVPTVGVGIKQAVVVMVSLKKEIMFKISLRSNVMFPDMENDSVCVCLSQVCKICAGLHTCLFVCVCSPRSAQVPASLNIFDLRHKCDFVRIVIRRCNKIL